MQQFAGAHAPLLHAVRVRPDPGLRPRQVQADDALLRALRRHGGERGLLRLQQEEAAAERFGRSREEQI